MIPIYYINLASRPDRRQYMESQFAALGIQAERIEAVTREQVPAHLLGEARLPDGKYRIGPSEMACSLSHFATWKRAFDSGATACLVFEDDAVISKALPDLMAALGDTLPPGIDLLKLEKMNRTVRVGSRPVAVGAFEARRLLATNYGMCGYIISREVAEEVMAGLPLSSLQIDDYVFARHGEILYSRQVFQLLPALSVQLLFLQAGNGDALARSDLEGARTTAARHYPRGLALMQRNLAIAWRRFRVFGFDITRPRMDIPFADDI